MLFDGQPGDAWGDTERFCRLVFIGRNLDETALGRGLARLPGGVGPAATRTSNQSMTGYSFDRWAVDAPLTGVAVDRSGRYAAFSGGDGAVRTVALSAAAPSLLLWRLTRGAVLTLVADCEEAAFLCGTDDGAVFQVHAEDGSQQLAVLARSWPDQLVTHPCGVRVIADGPVVRLLDGEGRPSGVLGPHPSTVAGLAFDDAGRRLAVSHYDGVTIWQLGGAAPNAPPVSSRLASRALLAS